jgi:glycosyltransferase involved in cell wall biosynthesis
MAKVSVLMAVYNAEQWLQESLDSLLRQDYADLQILCVDDGSTDSSWAILEDYAARDARVEIFRLPANGGQAAARNYALQHATGDYVAYLDSDDWMSEDAIGKCIGVFSSHPETDVVLWRLVLVEADGQRDYPMPPFTVKSGRDAFRESIDWSIHGCYVARRELYLRFPYDATCRSYSDDNTTRLHYYVSRQVRCCDGIYYYRYHAESVTHQVSVRRFDHLRANESMKRQLTDIGAPASVIRQYEQTRWLVLIDLAMFYYVHGSQLSPGERRYGRSELRRIWGSIDRSLLDTGTTAKFGYRPCGRWWLFCLQEWLYFSLRALLGRNR